MPVRSRIQSSATSRSARAARSALVTIFSGRAAPQPRMAIPIESCLPALSGAEPGDGLAGGDALTVDGDEPHDRAGEQRADLGGAHRAEQVPDLERAAGLG